MSKGEQVVLSPYRWVILAIDWGLSFFSFVAAMQVAALGYKLIPELHLSLSQFGMVLTAPTLPGIIFCFVGGSLADRFGVKAVISVAFVFSILAFFFRIAAHTFWPMFILMFFGGFVSSIEHANTNKLLGYWFPKEHLAQAMGIYFTGAIAGVSVALATTAMFPSVESAFMTSGILLAVMWVLWLVFVKNKPAGAPEIPARPVTKYMGVAARSRGVWLAGIIMLLLFGSDLSYQGFLPTALHAAHGINPQKAGFMVSLVAFGALVGAFVAPFIIGRFGKMKPYLVPAAFLTAIVMMASWMVSGGAAMWILFIVAGLLSGSFNPLVFQVPVLLPEIGPEYAGAGGGIVATLQTLGGFAIPSFVVAPLAGHNFTLFFLIASVIFLLAGIAAIFLPELGTRALKAMAGSGQAAGL